MFVVQLTEEDGTAWQPLLLEFGRLVLTSGRSRLHLNLLRKFNF